MRSITFAALATTFLFSPVCLSAQTAVDANLKERIERAKKKAARSKDGHVIYGQVVVDEGDDPVLVRAPMEILENGFFAGPTKDLVRPVGFRMHGYAPFDLELDGRKKDVVDDNVVDVGVIRMKRLEESKLLDLKGLLTLEDAGDPKTASLSISVANGPVNTPSNGTEPRRRWAKSVKVPVGETGLFDLGGFSPITYYCNVSAPGYVSHGFKIDFAQKNGAFTGRIKLEKPRRATIEYILAENGVFDLKSAKKTVLGGGDRWKVTPDIYGWDLEFKQQRGKLLFSHSYGPCRMADLGEADLNDLLNVDQDSATKSPHQLAVEDGHVYLMRQGFWKHDVLFKIKLEQKDE